MPKREKKRYRKPRKLYSKAGISEENELIRNYGLKNRREVWKAEFGIRKIRVAAKKLITAPEKDKQEFVERQRARGFEVNAIADVLGLNKEDYLKRRLQSVVVKKKLARTHKQARQFIVHKHITINGNKINSPAHLTTVKEETGVDLVLALPIKIYGKKKGNNQKEKGVEIAKEGEAEKV